MMRYKVGERVAMWHMHGGTWVEDGLATVLPNPRNGNAYGQYLVRLDSDPSSSVFQTVFPVDFAPDFDTPWPLEGMWK